MLPPPTRLIPEDLANGDNRRAFLEIAERARVERVNSYSVLCLGLQSYLDAQHLGCR